MVGSHGSAASTANTAQEPTPPRHPPATSPIGTVSPAPAVVPTASAVEYTAVIGPMRSGKCSLTRPGSSTLLTAPPDSATTLSNVNQTALLPIGRTAAP